MMAFIRSAPQDVGDEMLKTRAQYAGTKAVENMATDSGNISAARLANAAKNMPPATRELSTLGSAMRSLPDSGTAQRMFFQSLLSGGVGAGAIAATGDPMEGLKYGAGAMGGQLLGPYLASQLLTRAPVKNYLTSTLISDELYKRLGRLGAGVGGTAGLLSVQ